MPHGGPQFRLLGGSLRSRIVDDLSDVMDRLLNKDIPPLRLHPQRAQSQSGRRSTRQCSYLGSDWTGRDRRIFAEHQIHQGEV